MSTLDIMKRLAQIHNLLIQAVTDSDPGNKTIFLGDTIRSLRILLRELEQEASASKDEDKPDEKG